MVTSRACSQEIVIRDVERPIKKNLEKELEWLCESLGFCTESEKDRSVAVEVFKEIVKANYRHRSISSTKLCEGKGVTRGAIVYHLNKLMQSGLVIRRGRVYSLRAANLSRTLEEVEEDALRTLRRARRISEDIDRAFNMI